ncbi:glycosyltransferase [Paenibacillus sp. LMG 31460]|uniref:Glycosyltransferase n=2 Tax=Paenibacillus germinis TaxID=2654979 RepID=A0ABX1Z4F0_9BACL|nr:glycosyltransferase [Paenibacillus germinis]
MLSDEVSIIEDLKQQRYKEAELAAKDLIRGNPLEAQNWVFLGEALMHQGYGDAGNKAFQRAWLLDPEATWVAPVLDALKAVPPGDERVDIEGLLHVRKVSITAGIISYNMEDTIQRCLDSLQGAVDHIVLIDCSTDRTAELASEYHNVTIIPYEWTNDFAAARNTGLLHMHTDWVFWIDADEYLVNEDRDAVREVAGIYHDSVVPTILCLWQINLIQNNVKHNFSQTRLFPLGRGLRYWGRVHEQVGTESGIYNNEAARHKVKVRVFHDGYEPDVMASKQKIDRNLNLLRTMIEEDADNPAWWFYHGRELLGAGKETDAVEALIEAERRAIPHPLFGRLLDIYKYLMDIYYQRKDWEQTAAYCMKALDYQSDFPDAHYMLAQVRMKQADHLYREAETGFKKAKESFHSFRSIVSPDHEIGEWKVDVALGDIAHRAGKSSVSKTIYSNVLRQYPRLVNIVGQRLTTIEAERQRLNDLSK